MQYQKLFLHSRVKAYDNYNEYGIDPVEIDIKKCIKYVAQVWYNVIQETIENCWLKLIFCLKLMRTKLI